MKMASSPSDQRSILLRTIGTVLALVLLIYLLSQQGWTEIKAAFQQIPLKSILLAILLMVISRLAICVRWHILLRSGGLPISLGQTFKLTFAGLFANNFLPATIGGDIVRLAGAVQLNYDGTIIAASLIADRLVGMAGMAMTAPIGLVRVVQGRVLQSNAFYRSGNALSHSASYSLAQTVVIAMPFIAHSTGWFYSIWRKSIDLFHRLLSALGRWIKQPRVLLVSLAFSWVNMLCMFGFLCLVLHGMGQPVQFWLVAGLYSLVYFVTLIPISINGYGLQELSMTLIFSHYAGVTFTSGITAALLFRTVMMLVSLPGAIFVPGILAGEKKMSISNTLPGE